MKQGLPSNDHWNGARLAMPGLRLWQIYLPAFFALALMAMQETVPVELLTRDVNSIAHLPFYAGLFSMVGLLLWAASVTVSFFSVVLGRSRMDAESLGFLKGAGYLSLLLLVDDLAMVHERLAPKYLGLPEVALYAAYALFAVYLVIRYYRSIRASDYLPFLLAGVFLASSVILDVLPSLPLVWRFQTHLVEDGCKLLGIISWLVFLARFGIARLQAVPKPHQHETG